MIIAKHGLRGELPAYLTSVRSDVIAQNLFINFDASLRLRISAHLNLLSIPTVNVRDAMRDAILRGSRNMNIDTNNPIVEGWDDGWRKLLDSIDAAVSIKNLIRVHVRDTINSRPMVEVAIAIGQEL